MVQISKEDKEKVLEAIRLDIIDTAELSLPALADSIVLAMKQHGLIDTLNEAFEDKHSDNLHIPSDILLTLAITAKLKQNTSLTDIPFAITDAELLAELGWNAWDYGCDVNDGLFSESVMRKIPYVVGKVWTTDAIYRETSEAIEERRKQGCIAVEMECSASLAVAKFRNIPIIQFFYGCG